MVIIGAMDRIITFTSLHRNVLVNIDTHLPHTNALNVNLILKGVFIMTSKSVLYNQWKTNSRAAGGDSGHRKPKEDPVSRGQRSLALTICGEKTNRKHAERHERGCVSVQSMRTLKCAITNINLK